jgi:hypothetical protein
LWQREYALGAFLCHLLSHPSQEQIAWEFLQHLADFGDDVVKCSWFLALSQARLAAPSHIDRQVQDLLQNPDTLAAAWDLIFRQQDSGSGKAKS